MLQPLPMLCHAQMCQFTVLYAPHLSQEVNKLAIWKYNALYHLIAEHSNGGILPEIPGELLVKMFIHTKEEQAVGIDEGYTHGWRRENLIPDSDGLMAMMEDQQKRERSNTVSTTLSDKPVSKNPRYKGIPEPVPE